MSSHFTVVYDACVLYPAPLRDLLMHLALSDLYRARWSDMIHDEWTRNVLVSRPDLTQEQLNRTRQLMNAHVRDSLVFRFRRRCGPCQPTPFPVLVVRPRHEVDTAQAGRDACNLFDGPLQVIRMQKVAPVDRKKFFRVYPSTSFTAGFTRRNRPSVS